MLKPNVSAKRIAEIESIQSQLRKLAQEHKDDFAAEPNALDPIVDRDLQAAINSLELLKGLYKSKTEKKAK